MKNAESDRILVIVNRGEIVKRIAKSAKSLGFQVVTVHGPHDRDEPHVKVGDQRINLLQFALSVSEVDEERARDLLAADGPRLYLEEDLLIKVCLSVGASHVHPGYGFLSERASFAQKVIDAGMRWVGPTPQTMKMLGDKTTAREVAERAGVSVVPGVAPRVANDEELIEAAQQVGVPLMIKAAAGGGGRGMRVVSQLDELGEAIKSARREALLGFGDDRLLIEKYIPIARHVEVQLFGDQLGQLVHLGERDCTVQRRQQKIIEESPAPELPEELAQELYNDALKIGAQVSFESAGTVEFLLTPDGQRYFLEVNTRIQVEHLLTELLYEVDLVEWQLRVSDGEGLCFSQDELNNRRGRSLGHLIELRLCAESPDALSLPQSGPIIWWRAPQGAECVEEALGTAVSPEFDSMIAKLIFSGKDRNEAIQRALYGLKTMRLIGFEHNGPLLAYLLQHQDFSESQHHTKWFEEVVSVAVNMGVPDRREQPTPERGELSITLEREIALSALLHSIPLNQLELGSSESCNDGAWSSSAERQWSVDLHITPARPSGLSTVTPTLIEPQSFTLYIEPMWNGRGYKVIDSEGLIDIHFEEVRIDLETSSVWWSDLKGRSANMGVVFTIEAEHHLYSSASSNHRGGMSWRRVWERAEWENLNKSIWLVSGGLELKTAMNAKNITYQTALERRSLDSDSSLTDEGRLQRLHLLAPLSGRMSRIVVNEELSYPPHTTVAIIESMKLEYPIVLEEAGEIRSWLMSEGEVVKKDQKLALVRPHMILDET